MVSISLVMSVIVTNIYLRKDTSSRVPRCLRRLILRRDGGVRLSEHSLSLPPPPPPPPTSNGKLRQMDCDVWTVEGRGADADVTLSSRLARRQVTDSVHLGDIDDEFDAVHRRIRRDLAPFPDALRDPVMATSRKSSDLATSEWQELARIVDRLFFWLFMVSSIGLLTGLYVSIADRSSSTDDIS